MSQGNATAAVPAAPAGPPHRRSGRPLLVLCVSLAFTGITGGILITTHLAEVETPTESPTLDALHLLLEEQPASDQIVEAIRQEDARLRARFLGNRRRLELGAWLLLAGALAVVLSARWWAASEPRPVWPGPLEQRQDDAAWHRERRRSQRAVLATGLVFLAGLLLLAATGGGRYPRSPEALAPPADDLPDGGFTQSWPRFRGPDGAGTAPEGSWARTWDGATGEGILWRSPVPVPGKSSPVVWGNRVFLTGATAETQEVMCYRRDTGELLWRTRVDLPGGIPSEDLEVLEETGYAAATPVTDGERVYAVFATTDLVAVDRNGREVWAQNLGDPDSPYGLATSLVLYDGVLLFQFDRGRDPEEERSALLALDPRTGRTLWSLPRPVDASWSTPIVVQTPEGTELVTTGDPWIISYDLETRAERWRVRGLSGDVAPPPVVAGDLVVATNEYAQTLAIRTGGRGDVTDTHVVWTSDLGLSDAPGPVTDGRRVLLLHSSGELVCLEAATGELVWEGDLPGGSIWASPVRAGETVYLFGEKGRAFLLQLTDELEITEAGTVPEKVYGTPAFADSCIYVRGEDHLYAIGPGEDEPSAPPR